MAHASIMPPMLRLKRSAQSGAKALTAIYTVIYYGSSVMAYLFAGASIDLSPLQAGDIVDIRLRKQVVSGGALVNHDTINYVGPMPAGAVIVHIAPIPDVYGVEVAIRQTAGVMRTVDTEFYDAMRLGLA
jgi:hypothetical protein